MENLKFEKNAAVTSDATARGALVAHSHDIAREQSAAWISSSAAKSELPKFLDMTNPFSAPAEKPVQKHDEKQHDWFHDACDWVTGTADVATQVTVGAATKVYRAVTDHPLDTAVMVAEGVVIGAAVMAAAPVAAALGASAVVVGGIAAAADVAIVGMTAVGAANAGKDVFHAAKDSAISADVLMHKSAHSDVEVQAARLDVQTKTGGAALEAAMTLAVVHPAWNSGMRLVSSAGKALEGAGAGVGAAAARTELSAFAAEAPPAESVLSPRRPTPEWTKGASDKTNRFDLPNESATELMDKVDRVIAERQGKVDLKALTTRLDELRAENAEPARIDKFSKWIEDEMNLRHNLLADVVNDHASAMFPDRAVPSFKIKSLQTDSPTVRAEYQEGKLFFRDANLHEPSYHRDETSGMRMIDAIAHEMEHGEQDGLMMRNLIDIATSGDTTGRALTPTEITAVQDLAFDRAKLNFSGKMIEDINIKRAGKVLSSDDGSRAERLEASSKAHDAAVLPHRYAKEDLKFTSAEYDAVKKHGVSPAYFSEKFQKSLFGTNEIPAGMKELIAEFEKLPKSGTSHYTPEQSDFADRVTSRILRALGAEEQRLIKLVDQNYDDYRNWQHEAEAWKIGGQASKQMTMRDILRGEGLQDSVDQMTMNPIDYSEVFAY